MGTNVKSSDITPDKVKSFLNVFKRSNKKIIWKWEDDKLPEEYPNILIQKWLPQDDILAHPNSRLFISHCGLGGIAEAKFHGVPILCIPIFGDQPINAKAVVKEGWALEVPYENITSINIHNALKELLQNRTYTDNVKRMSLLFRDRPLSALDTAVYWVEYVLRHNGASHMRSEAVHLNFFQRNSYDVIAILMTLAFLLWKLTKLVCRSLYRCCGKTKLKTN